MKKIAIIVLNYHRHTLSFNLIQQLKTANTKPFFCHIILVDNASTKKSKQFFNKSFDKDPQITTIFSSKNLGFSGGVNLALNHAYQKRYDYALVINNDVDITKNFLVHLFKPFNRHSKLALTGPKIYFKKGHEYHKNYTVSQLGKVIWSAGGTIDWDNIYGQNRAIDQVDKGQFNQSTSKIDFISGCCFLADLKKLKEVNFFDDYYFMYMEDCDLCQRLKMAGYKIAYIPNSVIYHQNAGSSHAGGPLQQYYLSRNRLYFAKKFASPKTRFALFRQSILTVLFSKYTWQKRGILDYYFNHMGISRWHSKIK